MGDVIATGEVRSGRLKIRNWNAVQEAVIHMRDCEVLIRIERARATRSLNQNRWYWGCVVGLVADHTGYTPDEIHAIYKAKFIPKPIALANGNGEICGEFVIGGTTTQLDTQEFAAYCESIREWAADELGVVIPDPE
jgi:hypothetical protein